MGKFPRGTTLESELRKAMDRLKSTGISYPPGYFEKLFRKYSSTKIRHPHIIMRIGNPNIRRHPSYKKIMKRGGYLLDYGCGTGDDIRALIHDGYLRDKIIGFDINWNSVNLGFDLYMDKKSLVDILIVSRRLPFKKETFDFVYSGSVIHGLKNTELINSYLKNACNILKKGGIFFGSTSGADKRIRATSYDVPPTPLKKAELEEFLENAGFSGIVVSVSKERKGPLYRLWFTAIKG